MIAPSAFLNARRFTAVEATPPLLPLDVTSRRPDRYPVTALAGVEVRRAVTQVVCGVWRALVMAQDSRPGGNRSPDDGFREPISRAEDTGRRCTRSLFYVLLSLAGLSHLWRGLRIALPLLPGCNFRLGDRAIGGLTSGT